MKAFIIGICLGFISLFSFSQSSPPYTLPADPTNHNVIPPPPETSAFMRYGEYSVSKENGLPEISIPIHTITEGRLSVPVALTYHASGVKVDEKASWCGLSWSIQQGGMVSRTVRGHPDEALRGYLNAGIPTHAQFEPYDDIKYSWIEQIIAGESDSEPDEFNFSVPGASGRFFLNPQGIGVTQSFSDVRIEPIIVNYNITGFTITTADGTKYRFGQPCSTGYNTNHLVLRVYSNNTWYLEEISSPDSQDKIRFYYKQKSERTETRFIANDYVTNSYFDDLYTGYYKRRELREIPYTISLMKEIEYIESSTGKIVFNSSVGRLDGSVDLKLNSIDVYGADKLTVIKGFDFTYGYFVSAGGTTENHYRLKLVSLQERGKGAVTIPPYEFTYQEGMSLPPRYGFSQDYWGYPNGKPNASLLPVYKFVAPTGEQITLGDADRNANASAMKTGVIRTIKYPSKGYTEFTFESNTIKRTYTPTEPKNYSAFIYPPTGTGSAVVTEHYTDVPAMSQSRTVSLTYQIFRVAGEVNYNDMSVELKNMTTGATVFEYKAVTGNSITTSASLQQGVSYRLYVRSSLNQTTNKGGAAISVSWEQSGAPVTENLAVGGLRIQSIKNYSENNQLQTQKVYLYSFPDDPNYSSGSYNTNFLPEPRSFVGRRVLKWMTGEYPVPEGTAPCATYRDEIVTLTNTAFRQNIYSQGSAVTYEYVTELFAEPAANQYGKTIYKYDLYKDEAILGPIYEGGLDMSSLRGQIRKEEYYDNGNRLVKSKIYDYDVLEDVSPMISALKVGEHWDIGNNVDCLDCNYGGGNYCRPADVTGLRRERVYSQQFSRRFHWKRLSSITEVVDGVQSVQNFGYNVSNQHANIVTAASSRSDGKLERIDIRYAHELADNTLITRNIVGLPLQADHFVDNVLVKGSKVLFTTLGGNYLPYKYEDRLADGSFILKGEILEADAVGRPIRTRLRDGLITTMLWDQQSHAPLVQIRSNDVTLSTVTLNPAYSTASPGEVILREFVIPYAQTTTISTTIQDPTGAMNNGSVYSFFVIKHGEANPLYSHNTVGTKTEAITFTAGKYYLKSSLSLASSRNIITQVNLPFKAFDVYYNGFEESEGNSASGDCRSGLKSKTDGFTINLYGLVDGKPYKLSYWQKVNGNWIPQTNPVTSTGGMYTATLTGPIDEVRFHPSSVHMTTYAYDPVTKRVRSVDDANAVSQHYEFDDLGRLMLMRDQHRNILKSFQYYYKTQP